MGIKVVRKNITEVKADVVVNSANPYPLIGAGTDSAIYEKTGIEELYKARHKIGNIERGDARITGGFRLCDYIIHTVGPNYIDGKHNEEKILRKCYRNSLKLFKKSQRTSIVFPLISTGTYGFPKSEAIAIAISEMNSFLMKQTIDYDIMIAVLSQESFFMLKKIISYEKNGLSDDEERKIKLNEYGEEYLRRRRSEKMLAETPVDDAEEFTFVFSDDTKSFAEMLAYYINIRNEKPSTIYNRVKLDRRQFNKYLKDERNPSKKDAIKICIGLRLTLKESIDLLSRADHAFNPSDFADLVIMKAIRESGSYEEINQDLQSNGFRYFDD